jgi:hypothetical protein
VPDGLAPEVLRTERLVLVALMPELARVALARVALEDRPKLGRMLGARVSETWPGADFARMLPRRSSVRFWGGLVSARRGEGWPGRGRVLSSTSHRLQVRP